MAAASLSSSPSAPGLRYDSIKRRYIDARGRIVSQAAVRRAAEDVARVAAARMRVDAEALQAGRISIADWQLRMMRNIKTAHLATASAGRGGFAHLNQSDLGWAGREIRTQLEYLARFARQIETGAQPLGGQFLQRAGLYADASVATHREMEARVARLAGATKERWVVNASAEHCQGKGSCAEQAARGFVKAGTLPRIGSRLCICRCRCHKESDIDQAA